MSTRKAHIAPAVLADARSYLQQCAAERARRALSARAAYAQAATTCTLPAMDPAELFDRLRSEYEASVALCAYAHDPDAPEYVLPPDAYLSWEG